MNTSISDGRYRVCDTGVIVLVRSNKPMKGHIGKDGYVRIGITSENRRYTKYIHRLVAEMFIPNPNNLPEVNHIDGDKLNNCVHNLEWCSRSENVQHAYDSQLKFGPHLGKLGVLNHNSKPVIGIHKETGSIVKFPGVSEAARQIGKNRSSLLNVIAGRRKSSGGYYWKYVL